MNANTLGSWGVLSSSSAIVLVVGLLVLLVAHQGIRTWTKSAHNQLREHLFGPPQIHLSADEQTQHSDDDPQQTGDASDDFDYGIYAQAHEFTAPDPDEDEDDEH